MDRAPPRPAIPLPDGGTYIAQAKTFSPPPVLRGERNLEQLWRDAETAYNAGQYDRAEQSLGQIIGEQPESFDALLYRAICLLSLDRVAEARETLGKARRISLTQDLSTTSLAWFEALAALADGDPAAAGAALDEATAGTGIYADHARDLRARLTGS